VHITPPSTVFPKKILLLKANESHGGSDHQDTTPLGILLILIMKKIYVQARIFRQGIKQ
jgi:hypothetical protein